MSFLATGSDEEIDVFNRTVSVSHPREAMTKRRVRTTLAGAPSDRFTRGVLGGETQA